MVPDTLLKKMNSRQADFMNHFFRTAPDSVFHRALLKTYPRGHILIHSEDPCSNVYILLNGRLQAIEESVVDEPFCFVELDAIEIVGDFELFIQSDSRIITLSALDPALCLVIPSCDYISWITKDANALHLRIQMLVRQLVSQAKFEHHSLFLDSKMRILHLLYSECRKTTFQAPLLLPYTRNEIASRLGCSLRTVNRNISSLVKEGLITLQRGKIQISSQQADKIKSLVDSG